jgi:hypothetical protein
MPAKPYAEGSVAGVALVKDATNLKCQIIDAQNFYSAFVGSTRIAADGTPYTQLLNPGTKGVRFGVLLEFCALSVFTAIKAAIDAALAAETAFNITLADDVHTINVSAVPDFSSGSWIQYPAQRHNAEYVAGVTLRFIATA